jgi:membrane protease YdiL (CAAX protease family)
MRRVFESFPLSFRLVFIVPLIVVGYVVGMLVGLLGCMAYGYGPQEAVDLLSDFQNTSDVGVLRILQTCFQFGGFLLPALFFLWMFGSASVNKYMLRKPTNTWLLVPLITILSLPIMEVLISFNQKLIPAESAWGAALRAQEKVAESMMEQLLAMDGMDDLVLMLFIAALVPAIAEEFLFRGLIQNQLSKWTKNVHLGIWISAILFSAIHMQFLGFLPRLVLGALFGYLVIHTGSVWTAVLAHFLHNGMSVLGLYYLQNNPGLSEEELEQVGTQPLQLVFILLALSILGGAFMKRSQWSKHKTAYLANPVKPLTMPPQTPDHQE